MPNAKAEQLRRLSDSDLAKELEETYRRLFSLRMQLATQQMENHHEMTNVGRQIARIKTLQRERDLARALAAARGEGSPR
ncbi:MAG: 50S ribosomal protein L29 [Dehalococcoidia bacterium]